MQRQKIMTASNFGQHVGSIGRRAVLEPETGAGTSTIQPLPSHGMKSKWNTTYILFNSRHAKIYKKREVLAMAVVVIMVVILSGSDEEE